jgi:hypothetical protein
VSSGRFEWLVLAVGFGRSRVLAVGFGRSLLYFLGCRLRLVLSASVIRFERLGLMIDRSGRLPFLPIVNMR